jgi:quercetin dioxygenase-like cupin family protein
MGFCFKKYKKWRKTMKAQPKSTHHNKMRVIPRSSIPVITSVMVDGVLHNLGQLFDFHKHSDLASFIPENARPSFSWTKLDKDEMLSVHEHPTSSMIIIVEGQGEALGDCEQKLKAGDVVVVPPHQKHGFIGRGKDGFWALSIQFEGRGLYEDTENPRVNFVKKDNDVDKNNFALLLSEQANFVERFQSHPLIHLVQKTSPEDTETREKLLAGLNIWANWFQRIIYMRAAVGAPLDFQNLAEQHVQEEVGHNTTLLEMRQNKSLSFCDPILEATSSWFFEKMLSSTVEEKTILIHFVLEAAGDVFHKEALRFFSNATHFTTHTQLDEDHFGMGCRVLEKSGNYDLEKLRLILKQGWDMFDLLLSRIAHLAQEGHTEEKVDFARAS